MRGIKRNERNEYPPKDCTRQPSQTRRNAKRDAANKSRPHLNRQMTLINRSTAVTTFAALD